MFERKSFGMVGWDPSIPYVAAWIPHSFAPELSPEGWWTRDWASRRRSCGTALPTSNPKHAQTRCPSNSVPIWDERIHSCRPTSTRPGPLPSPTVEKGEGRVRKGGVTKFCLSIFRPGLGTKREVRIISQSDTETFLTT